MRRNDIEGVGHLGGLLVDELAGWAEEHHRAVSGRAFRWMGPPASPVKALHDCLTGMTYRRVRTLGRLGGQALGSVLAPLAGGEPVSASPAGGQVVATVDAVLGDRLEEAGNPLALPMTLRSRQTDVPLDRASLSDAFPNATPRVVVFVHGLGETDLSWIGRDDAGRPWSYANALEPSGWTGALVRYNTGRRIAANGASLATLLDEMVAAWPVEVADLALVGHSMGGLVLRSACATGIDAGHSWPALVRSCVYLGSPHHGAPLEQGVSALAWLLSRLPETVAVASALRLRSAGIQDLGRATLADAGQLGEEEQAEPEAGLLPSARHHLVAGRLGRTLFNPVAVLGDLMVGERSALGLGNRRVAALDPCERATFPGTHHYGLLKDRRVAEALAGWLG